MGSTPGSGRTPGRGHGHSLQYSCLENPMNRGAWWVTVPGVMQRQTRLSTEALEVKPSQGNSTKQKLTMPWVTCVSSMNQRQIWGMNTVVRWISSPQEGRAAPALGGGMWPLDQGFKTQGTRRGKMHCRIVHRTSCVGLELRRQMIPNAVLQEALQTSIPP